MGGGGGGGVGGWSTYNINYMTTTNYSRLPNLLPNKSLDLTFYFNNMIFILMKTLEIRENS